MPLVRDNGEKCVICCVRAVAWRVRDLLRGDCATWCGGRERRREAEEAEEDSLLRLHLFFFFAGVLLLTAPAMSAAQPGRRHPRSSERRRLAHGDVGKAGLEGALELRLSGPVAEGRQGELDLRVVELGDAHALALGGGDHGGLDDLDVGHADPVAGGHLLVHVLHGGVEGRLAVLLVHVVDAGTGLVANPDAEVLDGGGLLLEDLEGGGGRKQKGGREGVLWMSGRWGVASSMLQGRKDVGKREAREGGWEGETERRRKGGG